MSTLTIQASDVTGQKSVEVSGIPPDATVGDLLGELTSKMQLPINDLDGRPLSYQACLEREHRNLHPSESIIDCLRQSDEIVLQPNVDAG